MTSAPKDVCTCSVLEMASKEPNHPIHFDPQMSEYYISFGSGGRMLIRYCPFCGGQTPESSRESFFAHVSIEEEIRIRHMFDGIRTVGDVLSRYGPPDQELDGGSSARFPEREGTPARGEVFRTMLYRELSTVADVVFRVGTGDAVQGTWIAKQATKKSG